MPTDLEDSAFGVAEWSVVLLGELSFVEEQDWQGLEKGTAEFYSYHAVKWAIKYLERFIKKVLSSTERILIRSGRENRHLQQERENRLLANSEFFLSIHYTPLTELVLNAQNSPLSNKLKFHLLKLLNQLVSSNPSRFISPQRLPESELLMERMMPLLQRSQQDTELAETQPATFMDVEINWKMHHRKLPSCRIAATDLWERVIALLINNSEVQEAHQLITLALKLIHDWVFSGSEEAVEIGLYLLACLSRAIKSSIY